MVAMPSASRVVDAGIDWITATTQTPETGESMLLLARHLIQDAIAEGNAIHPWGMAGYHGQKAGPVQFGVKEESTLIRLSSNMAHNHWREVYQHAANISRLDVQTTVCFPQGADSAISTHYQQAKKAARIRNGTTTLSILATNNGPSTVYFNRRISDRFGRIYNKHAESKRDDYRDCVRYELELKRDAALSAADSIHQSKDEWTTCAGIVSEFFRVRGCLYRCASHTRASAVDDSALQCVQNLPASQPGVSDRDRQCNWLAKSVRPTVEKLLGHIGVSEVLTLLGLDQLAQPILHDDNSTR